MTEVHIVATFVARTDSVNQTADTLKRFLDPSRKEAGCLYYHLQQNAKTPTEFLIIDGWDSATHAAGHESSQHVAETLNLLGPLLAQPAQVLKYRRIS